MDNLEVMVEHSARHVHLSQEHVELLFGAGHQLTVKKELSQPGQYLSEEKVTLEGPKGKMERVSVLGPARPASQVEITATDARKLGISPPVRDSGDVAGSAPITLISETARAELPEGAIIAKRHIHITPADAEKYGFKNGEDVSAIIKSERGLRFDKVLVRVSDKFNTAMHIDTDEANAAGFTDGMLGTIIRDS